MFLCGLCYASFKVRVDYRLTALFFTIAQILILLLLLFLWEQMSMAGAGGSNLTGSLQTCAQLQPPHVAHHHRGIKGLLQ